MKIYHGFKHETQIVNNLSEYKDDKSNILLVWLINMLITTFLDYNALHYAICTFWQN